MGLRLCNITFYLSAGGDWIIGVKWRVAYKHLIHNCTEGPPEENSVNIITNP